MFVNNRKEQHECTNACKVHAENNIAHKGLLPSCL